ncbi:MAG TPA: fibronectin type III domain-containing protein [Flavobacteriales bacterium]|nr:fibronectin type III domain-containing protein [Flavobacteriales bacterium]
MKLIKTDLRGLNALQVLTRARMMYNAMKDNPLFPAPTPSLAEFQAGIERLSRSVIDTHMGGNRMEFLLKQQHKDEVSNLIKSLSAYVSIVAQGDPSIAMAAGLEFRKDAAPISRMSAPQELRARTGALPGTIKLRWKPVHGARLYRVFVYKGYGSTDKVVRDFQQSASNCLIDGLEPLEYYTFRVEAIGTRVVSPLSDITSALSIGMKPNLGLAAGTDRLSLRA